MNKASLFLYQYDSGGTAIAQPETLVTAPSGAALSAQRAKAERVACVTGTAHLTMGIGYWFNDGPVDVTVWVALPQMEKGEFVTMPILPPAGTPGATTRNGDSGFVSLAANLLDNGGTLFAETKSSGSTATLSDTGGILVSSSGGADVVNLRGVGGSVSYLDAIATKASVVQFDSGNLPISFGETQRVAAAWATNSVDIAGDGISLGTYTSSANPIVTILKIYSGERRVHVRKIKVFNSRLNIGQVNSISRTGSPVDLSLLGYDSGMIPAGVAAGYMQTANIAPAEVTGRYCLLEAWDAGNPDGFLSVPLAYAGPAWEPAYNFGWATAFAIDATQVVTQTRGGQEYPNLLFEQRRHDVAFDAIKSAEVWPLAMEAWRIGRRGGNLLFIPNPASDDLQREAIFGRIAQLADVGYSQGTLDFRTWRFRITERL
jgi:hypothetical protein